MSPEEYKAIREKLALTQAELATRLGVTRRTVINREMGRLITAEAELSISALSKPTEPVSVRAHKGEDGAHSVLFSVGSQQFAIVCEPETSEEAEWFVTQLRTALSNAGALVN